MEGDCIWLSAANDQGIWYSSFDGNTWTPQQNLSDRGSYESPSLAEYGGRLYMAWRGINWVKDGNKLERLLKRKKRQKEEVMYMEDTQQKLVTEIEMLKVVLYLVCRNNDTHTKTTSNNQH
jgi:hypothetical protein